MYQVVPPPTPVRELWDPMEMPLLPGLLSWDSVVLGMLVAGPACVIVGPGAKRKCRALCSKRREKCR